MIDSPDKGKHALRFEHRVILGERFREEDTFDGALLVLNGDNPHLLPGILAIARHDDASILNKPDQHDGFIRRTFLDSRRRNRAERGNLIAPRIDRMARHVHPHRFFFIGERLRRRPRLRANQSGRRGGRCFIPLSRPKKERALPRSTIARR